MPRQFTASPIRAEDTKSALFVLLDRRGEGGTGGEKERKKQVREKLGWNYLPPQVLLKRGSRAEGKKAS